MCHSSSTLDNSTKLYVAKFEADAAERQKLTRRGVAAAKTAFVVWLGTMTDARRSYSLDVGSSSTVTLVRLVDNSTLGNQSSLAAPGGKVQLTAGEAPLLELIGSQPQPPTGPVPPIDAPTPYACKAPNGSSLPTGLHCGDGSNHPASLAPEPTSTYRVCPSGSLNQCPDGQLCKQTDATNIACVANPASPCDGKKPGLYCSRAPKPGKGWADAYVHCPSVATFTCQSTAPNCVAVGNTGIRCS